jgi:hypothetical protein
MSETPDQRKHWHEPVGRAPAVAQPSACTGTRGKFFNDFSRAQARMSKVCGEASGGQSSLHVRGLLTGLTIVKN